MSMHGRFCFSDSLFQAVILLREGEIEDEYNEMLKVLTTRALPFYASDQADRNVHLRAGSRTTLPKIVKGAMRSPDFYPADVLKLSVRLTCPGCLPPSPNQDERAVANGTAGWTTGAIELWLRDVMFAANLTWPGAACLVDGVVWRRGRVIRTLESEYATTLIDARTAAHDAGWPTFGYLEFFKTWKWLRRQPGFLRRFGGGSVGRALNALSHIASGHHDRVVELMWAMIGIEALFTRGGAALLEQVRERSRLLIGDSPRARKIISNMYEVRSRFVHGDLDFSGQHLRDISGVFSEPAEKSLREASSIGVAILLASVRELIARDWSGLEFKTSLASA